MNSTTTPDTLAARIERVRRFDCFYERRLERAQEAALINELSVTELRVFHALGSACGPCTSIWLSSRLGLDPGYLCRILKKFCAYRFAAARQSVNDLRHRDFELTDWGRNVFRDLEAFHRGQVLQMLEALPQRQQRRLVRAMTIIEEVLTRDPLDNLLEAWRTSSR